MSIDAYNPGKMKDIIDFIGNFRGDQLDFPELGKALGERFPELLDKKNCPNCGASMEEYIFQLDHLDALLLLGMAKIIREKVNAGMAFGDANAVHVQSAPFGADYYSVRSRTTQCSKLGLLTKVKAEDGRHDREKGWLITARGFSFLRGEPVPKKVAVWRNEIQERFLGDTITIDEVFDDYREKMNRKALRAKEKDEPWNTEHLPEVNSFSKNEWVEFGKTHEGKLL